MDTENHIRAAWREKREETSLIQKNMGNCSGTSSTINVPLSGDESEEECKYLMSKGSVHAAEKLLAADGEVVLDLVPLGPRGSSALATALASDTCRAERLSLRKCHLMDFVLNNKLIEFSKGLAANSSVRILDLSGNMLDDYSTEHLAEGVATNSTLEILILQANAIGSNGGGSGYRALSKALEDHPSLVELRIGANRKDGLATFILSMARARSLKALYLTDPGGSNPNSRVKCEACSNIGHAARAACEMLAASRADLMVCYVDAQHRIRFLNEPHVDWVESFPSPGAEPPADITRATPCVGRSYY